MKDSQLLNLHKTKFRHTLVGKWSSTEGTFQMMQDVFNFHLDGNGTWETFSQMLGDRKINFQWKEKAPYVIELREEGEQSWVKIMYDFKIIENDVSKEVILYSTNSNLEKDTFYLAMTRISYFDKISL